MRLDTQMITLASPKWGPHVYSREHRLPLTRKRNGEDNWNKQTRKQTNRQLIQNTRGLFKKSVRHIWKIFQTCETSSLRDKSNRKKPKGERRHEKEMVQLIRNIKTWSRFRIFFLDTVIQIFISDFSSRAHRFLAPRAPITVK